MTELQKIFISKAKAKRRNMIEQKVELKEKKYPHNTVDTSKIITMIEKINTECQQSTQPQWPFIEHSTR